MWFGAEGARRQGPIGPREVVMALATRRSSLLSATRTAILFAAVAATLAAGAPRAAADDCGGYGCGGGAFSRGYGGTFGGPADGRT